MAFESIAPPGATKAGEDGDAPPSGARGQRARGPSEAPGTPAGDPGRFEAELRWEAVRVMGDGLLNAALRAAIDEERAGIRASLPAIHHLGACRRITRTRSERPLLRVDYFFAASPLTIWVLCAPFVVWMRYPSCPDSQTSAST